MSSHALLRLLRDGKKKKITCLGNKILQRFSAIFKEIKRLHQLPRTLATPGAPVDLDLEETDCIVRTVPLIGPQEPEPPWPLPLAPLHNIQPSATKHK